MSDFSLKYRRFEKQVKEEKIKSDYPKCWNCEAQLPNNAKICYNCGSCQNCKV